MRARFRFGLAVVGEALASARSQVTVSVLTTAMVAGGCLAVLLTTGRTVAAEEAVLAQIDSAGTRSIIVRADDANAGLTVGVLDRLSAVTGIAAAVGFGPAVDVRNSRFAGGPKVAARIGYGSFAGQDLFRAAPNVVAYERVAEQIALASDEASSVLGLIDGTGSLISDSGQSLVVAGQIEVPDFMAFLEPLVIVPAHEAGNVVEQDKPLSILVVLVDSPQHVRAVASAVQNLLGPVDPRMVTMQTSTQLADIRAAVAGELGSYGRGTVLGILGVSSVLLAATLLSLVTLRRKDFGRRRALGAKRSLIVALLLTQVALLAAGGASVGVAASLVVLRLLGSPAPPVAFTGAVTVLAILTAIVSALLPAAIAARRDPLLELRVP